VFFRSSDVNRTLMSALLVAAGLYGNVGQTDAGWPIEWQPIPVHTWPRRLDPVLSEDDEVCPQFVEIQKQFARTPFIRAMQEQNREFFQFLSKNSGFDNIGPINISWVFDILRCQRATGRRWPNWANETVYDKASSLYLRYVIREAGIPEKIRLRTGMFLKDLLERLNGMPVITGGTESRLKLYAYSGHDTNILFFLSALNLTTHARFRPPDFASCVLLELWQNSQVGLFLKILYRSNSSEEFKELQIPGCVIPCRLQAFDSLLRRYVPTDWEVECGAKHGEAMGEVLRFIIASFSLTIFILFSIIIISTALLLQRSRPVYTKNRQVDTLMLRRLLDENTSESEFSSVDIVDARR